MVHKITKVRWSTLFFLLAWGNSIAIGLAVFALHAGRPGAAAALRVNQLAISDQTGGGDKSTLMMFIHPQCPCSHASIDELKRLMTQCKGRLLARVFIFQPSTHPDDWCRGDLWNTAGQIPGVTVQADRDASMAKLFGAFTSGQVLLYDPRGRLEFSGGITASRGHEGDNDGVDAVVDLVLNQKSSISRTPVFGCALYARKSGGEP